jgi:2-dehydro-3-deoxy-L-rhamnonate dehydrogenase (NAD+)
MYQELAGKRAIVTGAAGGIGAAVARRLAAEGARVALLDVADAGPAAEEISPDSIALRCDVRSADQVTAAVSDVAEAFGGIDIVVNNAGVIGPVVPLRDYPEDEFLRVLDIDLVGTYRVSRAALPHLLDAGWGRIVNIASIAGKNGNPRMTAYAAAKAGIIGFTKALGRELATSGVLVNAVAPGGVGDTGITGSVPVDSRLDADPPRSADPWLAAAPQASPPVPSHPMGRLGRPDEVAALVVWLCSEQVSFSTGAVYDISGGRATY